MDNITEEYNALIKKYKSKENIRRWVIIGLSILLLILVVGTCNRINKIKTNLNTLEQNEKALSDSLRTSHNKVGDLESSINVLITDKKKLLKFNNRLAKQLKKEKGKVHQLNEIIANYKPELVEVPVEVIKYDTIGVNKVYGLSFEYDTVYDKFNYNKLDVETKFSIDTNFTVNPIKATIKNNEIGFNLVTGLRDKDDNIEIFARSDHPNLNIVDMEGAIIDPKKHPVIKSFTKPKRFGIGAFGGLGFGGNANHVVGGVFVGVGITYDFIQF